MTTEQSAQALERCPFCGGTADPAGWLDGNGKRGPECESCGATAESADAWNRRHQPAAAQLAGWKLVPVEPTQEMLLGGQTAISYMHPATNWVTAAKIAYSAMLDAAPPPPTQPKEPSNAD